jgi:hypothetical protein
LEGSEGRRRCEEREGQLKARDEKEKTKKKDEYKWKFQEG